MIDRNTLSSEDIAQTSQHHRYTAPSQNQTGRCRYWIILGFLFVRRIDHRPGCPSQSGEVLNSSLGTVNALSEPIPTEPESNPNVRSESLSAFPRRCKARKLPKKGAASKRRTTLPAGACGWTPSSPSAANSDSCKWTQEPVTSANI